MARYIDADKLKPDTKTFTSAYSEELIEFYSQKVIDNALIIDVAPVVHAHWKGVARPALHMCDDLGNHIYHDITAWRCSICDRKTVIKEKFCPNCGAMMDEEDGDNR